MNIEEDPTRCIVRNKTIYVKEKLRIASEYFQKGDKDKGLLLIEKLLNDGDIMFSFPMEWLDKKPALKHKLQIQGIV